MIELDADEMQRVLQRMERNFRIREDLADAMRVSSNLIPRTTAEATRNAVDLSSFMKGRAELVRTVSDISSHLAQVNKISQTAASLGAQINRGQFETLGRAIERSFVMNEDTVAAMASQLQELKIPDFELDYIYRSGIDSDTETEKTRDSDGIITDVRFVNERIFEMINEDPEEMREMDWRDFEKLVAEILYKRGYDVHLTPGRDDGGFDIYAAEHNDFGNFLYIVECKRWDSARPIGPNIVRSVWGVVGSEDASAGMIATTSRFTPKAETTAETYNRPMELKDYEDIKSWLSEN